jgi:hypothetical protein
MHNRRDFLKATGVFAAMPIAQAVTPSLLLSPVPVPALPKGDRKFFILIRAFGGMDATLGIDPWTAAALPAATDMFVEYRPDELVAAGAEIKLGPSAAILKKHEGDFSVINGVFMSQVDNGHGASLSYIGAGSSSGLAPVLPVEMAAASQLGDFGVLTNSSLDMGNRVATSSNLSDLAQIEGKTDITGLLEAIFGSGGVKTPYLDSVRKVISSRSSVQTFIKNLHSFGAPADIKDMHVIAAAFMTEVAFYAQNDLFNLALDTHAAHPDNHKRAQGKVWAAVDELFTLFKKTPYGTNGESLFDRTTFMVVCEFSRTPALNGANGKDHNPLTNSVLLAGRGIQGGKVCGASRLVTAKESVTGASYHIAYPIDFATGAVQYSRTPSARMIFPEHVAQTVAQVMGVDANRFHSIAADIPALQALIKP